jgi:hypothetical protein
VFFNKAAIEHNSRVPSSFSALITQVLPNNNSWCLNRDLKDNFDNDTETLTEGGK